VPFPQAPSDAHSVGPQANTGLHVCHSWYSGLSSNVPSSELPTSASPSTTASQSLSLSPPSLSFLFLALNQEPRLHRLGMHKPSSFSYLLIAHLPHPARMFHESRRHVCMLSASWLPLPACSCLGWCPAHIGAFCLFVFAWSCYVA
jgi:hypothetical protein